MTAAQTVEKPTANLHYANRILAEYRVTGDDCKILQQGLRNQYPIKGGSMVPGKISHCIGMLGSYRQHLKTLHFHNFVKIRRKFQFADRLFDTDFPYYGGAQDNDVVGI